MSTTQQTHTSTSLFLENDYAVQDLRYGTVLLVAILRLHFGQAFVDARYRVDEWMAWMREAMELLHQMPFNVKISLEMCDVVTGFNQKGVMLFPLKPAERDRHLDARDLEEAWRKLVGALRCYNLEPEGFLREPGYLLTRYHHAAAYRDSDQPGHHRNVEAAFFKGKERILCFEQETVPAVVFVGQIADVVLLGENHMLRALRSLGAGAEATRFALRWPR